MGLDYLHIHLKLVFSYISSALCNVSTSYASSHSSHLTSLTDDDNSVYNWLFTLHMCLVQVNTEVLYATFLLGNLRLVMYFT